MNNTLLSDYFRRFQYIQFQERINNLDFPIELRYNHNHDQKGRFCSGGGGRMSASEKSTDTQNDLTSTTDNGIIKENTNSENNYSENSDKSQKSLLDFKRIQGEHTWEQDAKSVNPLYETGKREYTTNCQRCVCAYEMRRRGYDVTAKPRLPDNIDKLPYMNETGWPSVFKDYELIKLEAKSARGLRTKAIENMEKWGNGSRAIVRVFWNNENRGHVFIAEQIKGNTVFLDPQCGKLDVKNLFLMSRIDKTYIMRIDNLEVTDKIFECCK